MDTSLLSEFVILLVAILVILSILFFVLALTFSFTHLRNGLATQTTLYKSSFFFIFSVASGIIAFTIIFPESWILGLILFLLIFFLTILNLGISWLTMRILDKRGWRTRLGERIVFFKRKDKLK